VSAFQGGKRKKAYKRDGKEKAVIRLLFLRVFKRLDKEREVESYEFHQHARRRKSNGSAGDLKRFCQRRRYVRS